MFYLLSLWERLLVKTGFILLCMNYIINPHRACTARVIVINQPQTPASLSVRTATDLGE